MCRLRYSIVTARETNDASSSFTQVNIRKEGDKMSFLKKLFHHTHTYKEDTNMTNKDKALALINTFATGDTDAAKNLLAEGYIQHNTGSWQTGHSDDLRSNLPGTCRRKLRSCSK